MTEDDLLLKGVLKNYDGPMLIERIQTITTNGFNGTELVEKSALAALEHLDKVQQFSPYLEHFVSLLGELNVSADVSKYKSTQWLTNLRNVKNKRLAAAENSYYEVDSAKSIEIVITYLYSKQYSEAQSILSGLSLNTITCETAEISAQVGLLQGNLNQTLNQDKRIESFISTSLSNDLYLKRLTEREVTSHWRVKFLILYAEFLKQNYTQVSLSIYELMRTPALQTSSSQEISAWQVLNDSNFNRFISKDEIILISALSILVSRPTHELNDVLSEQEFISFVGPRINEFRPLFNYANSGKYDLLFALINSYDVYALNNHLITRIWSQLKLTFRQKAYGVYLSLVLRVGANHLSERLYTPQNQLIRELNDYIKENNLEFEFNEDANTFERIKVDKQALTLEKLQKISEDSDTAENALREKLEVTRGQFAGRLQ